MISLDEYQKFCLKALSPHGLNNCLYFPLGLAGECGEVCELFKKATRDNVPIDKDKVIKELGDVMWYIANICSVNAISLQQVVQQNVNKLEKRYGEQYKKQVQYRLNGPHIAVHEKDTGKFIKFCSKEEVPKEILAKLMQEREDEERKEEVPWEE